MKKTEDTQSKKQWTAPTFKDVPIFFESTHYAAAADEIPNHA
jgi:hypothetical protein